MQNTSLPASALKENQNLNPDVVKITRAEAKVLYTQLEMLRRGDLGEVCINDGTQTIKIHKGVGDQMLARNLTAPVADTTLAQNMTITLGGGTLKRFSHAIKSWGDNVTAFTFSFNDQAGFTPTLRVLLAAGS